MRSTSAAHQQSPSRVLWERSLLASINILHNYFWPFTVLVGTAGCELGWGQAEGGCVPGDRTRAGEGRRTQLVSACMTTIPVPLPMLGKGASSQANPAPFYFLHSFTPTGARFPSHLANFCGHFGPRSILNQLPQSLLL